MAGTDAGAGGGLMTESPDVSAQGERRAGPEPQVRILGVSPFRARGLRTLRLRPAGWSWAPAAVVLLCLAIAASIFATMQVQDWRERSAVAEEREQAVAAAEKVAQALSTTDFETADQDLDELLDLTTGDLAATIQSNRAAQADLVKEFKVLSSAEVEEAGVVSQSADQVAVAVAVTSTIENSRNADGEEMWYRMVIEMQKQSSDGQWLAANVEFVQ